MLQLVTALKLITAVVIECAVVTLVTLSVVRRLLSDKRPQISREPVSQCDRHRWVHRAKATEQDMLLVSQLAQLRPRSVQLHRRACVQRVQLQLSIEADKLKHNFFGYHCTAGLRGTLREFTEFQVVKFLFTFSNRCELVFARGLVRSAGHVVGVAMWERQDGQWSLWSF